MYLYFNSQGVLKEIINDIAIRQGDATTTVTVDGVLQEVASDVNNIYFFIEGADPQVDSDGVYQALTFAGIKQTYFDVEGTQLTEQTDVSLTTVEKEIPYDKKRELKHFKYFTKYEMFRAIVPNDVTNESRTIVLRLLLVNTDLSEKVLGPIVFNVEYTGGKAVVWEDTAISVAQWNYLVANMAMVSNVVTLTDDQTIAGEKTFTSGIWVGDSLRAVDTNWGYYGPTELYVNRGAIDEAEWSITLTTHTDNDHWGFIVKELGTTYNIELPLSNGTLATQEYSNLHYVNLTGAQSITGVKTFKNRIIVDGWGENGVISLLESKLETNNKNSFASVWVDSHNYVNYSLPYGPTDAGQNLQTHIIATKYYVDQQINEVEMQSDVIDVVGTYADLQAYDTQHVKENDLIKVITDSTHNNATSYYRWVSNAWVYVASEGPYYTTSQADNLFVTKTTQIAGVQIGSGISATTLYSAILDITEITIDED